MAYIKIKKKVKKKAKLKKKKPNGGKGYAQIPTSSLGGGNETPVGGN